jgi:hypothetical protein
MCQFGLSSALPTGAQPFWSKRVGRRLIPSIFCLVFAVAQAEKARGELTTINPAFPGEASLPQILSQTYGGSFTSEVGDPTDLTNGSLTALRIDDGSPSVVPTVTPDGTNTLEPLGGSDELWQGDVESAQVIGLFAADTQAFGFIPDASGNSYQQIFAASGYGYAATGSASSGTSLVSSDSGVFRFARTGNDGNIMSSLDQDNSDGMDHMVTYEIQGLGNNLNTYVLAFEDTPLQDGGDFDFNDLVVQITGPAAVQSEDPATTPEPGTTLAGAAMTLLLARRRRA